MTGYTEADYQQGLIYRSEDFSEDKDPDDGQFPDTDRKVPVPRWLAYFLFAVGIVAVLAFGAVSLVKG